MFFLLKKIGGEGKVTKVNTTNRIPQPILLSFPQPEEIHGCVVLRKKEGLCCMLQVPVQEERTDFAKRKSVPLLGQGHVFQRMAFFVGEKEIWFADYDGLFLKIFQESKQQWENKTPEVILYRFFCKLVEKDVQVLDVIYKQLAALEEEIPRDNARFFLQKMYTMKHCIYQLFRYYHQLTEMGEDLMEWDGSLLQKEEMQRFEKFVVRTKRLSDDMEVMREYAMEIWEIYQSQINIRQNDIMKVLTIVTTIFLPLSLLVGWYGMNFEYMPELSWKYGYLMVFLLGVSVVIFSLVLFRRKKYW